MKTFRLLTASLLIAVCAGFSSCGDDELDDFQPATLMPLDFINEDMMRIGILRSGFHALHPQFLLPTQPPASKTASQISVNCNRFPFRFSENPYL